MNDEHSIKADLPPGSEDLPDSIRPVVLALWEHNRALSDRVAFLEAQLNQTRRSAILWAWILHPYAILAASIVGALAFAALVILDQELALGGDRHTFFLVYMVPISAPFIAFLLDRVDRAANLHHYSAAQIAIDLPVVVLSFVRAFYSVPLISGHALFLTYALLTVKSRVAQILSALVLIEVIYLKIFAWHDMTLVGGALLGILAVFIFKRL